MDGVKKMAISLNSQKRFNGIRAELDKETDRGCVLLSSSLIDVELERLFKMYLVDDEKSFEKIFKNTGGLATFSSKIEMLYLIGLLTQRMKDDLHIIRKIRNKFAHSAEPIDFSTNSISDLSKNLKSHYRLKSDLSNLSNQNPRKVFISTIACIYSDITNKQGTINQIQAEMHNEALENEKMESVREAVEEYGKILADIQLKYKDHPNREKLIQTEMNEVVTNSMSNFTDQLMVHAINNELKLKKRKEGVVGKTSEKETEQFFTDFLNELGDKIEK